MADGPLSCLSGYLIIPEQRRWAREEGKVQDERRCDREGATEGNKVWHAGSVCVTCADLGGDPN